MNLDGLHIHIPANEYAWENWVQHLLEKKHGTKANAYGRRGTEQYGIDFLVDDGNLRIGVQCKFVTPGSKLNVKKVAEDIEASRAISPPIKRFVLYSSAQSDTRTADALDALKPIVRAQGREFEWLLARDFEEEVRTHNLIGRIFGLDGLDPAAAPVGTLGQAADRPIHDSTAVSAQPATTVQAGSAIIYSQMLDEVKDLIGAKDSAGAMALVDAVLKGSSRVPSTELARAYATKAILIGRAGQFKQSAQYWQKAADIEPDPNLKHGRRAQALLCDERNDEALAAALPGLDLDPPSSLAALAALTAGQRLGRRGEIDNQLSDRLKGERDVGLVRAHLALADGEVSLAEELVIAVDKAHPDDSDVIALRADLLLRRALGGWSRQRAEVVTGAELAALEAAIPLFRQSIEGHDPIREQASWLPSALNYLSALKLLGRHEDAADIALKIIDALGTDFDDFGRALLALAEGGKEARAIELSSRVPSDSIKGSLARASALLHLDRYGEAQTILEDLQIRVSGDDADNIAWMLVVAKMRTRPGTDLSELATEFFETARNKLSACARIVENAAGLGYPQVARGYAEKAINLFEVEPRSDYLLLVADAMLMLDRHEDALRLLLPQVDLEHPQGGPLEERLAFCLLRQHRFETLGKLLSGLPTEAPDAARFDPYRIDYHLGRGDRLAALMAIREAIGRRSDDLKLRILEIALLRQQGDVAEAKAKLAATVFQIDAPLGSIKLYVHEARELGEELLAEEAAYQWIRKHGDVSENSAWFIADYLMGRRADRDRTPLSEVTTRCGICLRSNDEGHKPRWIVIDDRHTEDVAAGWFSPHSDRISDLIGKASKTVVDFRGFPGGPFTIEMVLPIFDGAFQVIQSRYGRDLPMVGSLQYMSLKGEGDELDISPILKMLDDSKSATLRALSVYAETPMPIGVMAQVMGRNPIDFWSSLLGTENPIRAMSGSPQASALFNEYFGLGVPDIVVDPVTLVGWDALGLLPTILRAVGSISMTVSGAAVIRHKRDDVGSIDDRPSMSMGAGEKEGQYIRTEITADMTASIRQAFDGVLSWIDSHVSVVPVPSSGMLEDAYSAMSKEWPSYIADSMQLAAHENRVLIADDIGIEVLSASFQVKQAPTVALLRAAALARRITEVELAHAIREMAKANYDFTSFNADAIWAVTDTEAVSMTPNVADMLRYLRVKSLNVASGLHVVCGYLSRLANNRISKEFFAASLTISLSALTRHATRETSQVFNAVAQFCVTRLPASYAKVADDALMRWLRGHFLSLKHVDLDPEPVRPTAKRNSKHHASRKT